MKSKMMTSEQFDSMFGKKLFAHQRCCGDILRTLAGIAIDSGLSEEEASRRYEKAMEMMEDAMQKAGDEIDRHV